jgi:hypothetical protein
MRTCKGVQECIETREILAEYRGGVCLATSTANRIYELKAVLKEICDIYWSLPVPGPRDWDPLFERARDLLEKQS